MIVNNFGASFGFEHLTLPSQEPLRRILGKIFAYKFQPFRLDIRSFGYCLGNNAPAGSNGALYRTNRNS